ncbi:hypothetical protein GGTG_13490 [Gaeumannomyces tritici R3-111a-1]|uniref:Uncharacterized protein n=1 Tax=Gaeumannomyces tritici (strain R3-111a-1) TaxID=644352 RepID=J3PJ08_GAET3|nr:hypothetical protein GGTG_13490 [Gaeumannomyces tritici R3-111a-1]EJT68984.1 hypothetical protein GGTG_13490 [Gaeumannomyces tritici R3-111a-1]
MPPEGYESYDDLQVEELQRIAKLLQELLDEIRKPKLQPLVDKLESILEGTVDTRTGSLAEWLTQITNALGQPGMPAGNLF